MCETFNHVLNLVKRREVRIFSHGYDELAADEIFVRDIIEGVTDAVVVEDYPNTQRVHGCWSYKKIGTVDQFTLIGEFRRMRPPQPFSSLPRGLILRDGKMIS